MGFFGNLAQSFFAIRGQRQDREFAREQAQQQGIQDMFRYAASAAAQHGDSNALGAVLRSMGDYATAGQIGGKKGKAGQQTVLHQFADMLQNGQDVQVPDASAYPQPTSDTAPQGLDDTQSLRPRSIADLPKKTVRQPLFKSKAELTKEAFEAEKPEIEFRANLATEKAIQQQNATTDRAVKVQEMKTKADAVKQQRTAKYKAEGKVNELAASIQADDPTISPEDARQLAGSQIRQSWTDKQEQAEKKLTLQTDRLELDKQRFVDAQKRTAIYGSQVGFKQREAPIKADVDLSVKSMQEAMTRIRNLQTRRAIEAGRSDLPTQDIAANIADLDNQIRAAEVGYTNAQGAYQSAMNRYNDLTGAAVPVQSDIPTRLMPPPRKTQSRSKSSSSGNDPMGIFKR